MDAPARQREHTRGPAAAHRSAGAEQEVVRLWGGSRCCELRGSRTLHWRGCAALSSCRQRRGRFYFCYFSVTHSPLVQGFDGYKWLSDLHVLDVGKLEEGAITSARCVADDGRTPGGASDCAQLGVRHKISTLASSETLAVRASSRPSRFLRYCLLDTELCCLPPLLRSLPTVQRGFLAR